MTASEQKVAQYLSEARASENALVRALQSQIAMTPRGSYRLMLENHLNETREHSERIGERLEELGRGRNLLMGALAIAESVIGQMLALSKTPWDLFRGSGGEEMVLGNAKDSCATESLEIATYAALEQIALAAGDAQTAELAVSIREDEERMLERVMREIPKLAGATYRADVEGRSLYDVSTTGAGETVRGARTAAKTATRTTTNAAKRNARQARRVPGVARAEGKVKGAFASKADLAIGNYDALNVDEIASRLSALSQIDLAKIDAYERKHENRTTVLNRIGSLQGDEPWAGYDELTVTEVQDAVKAGSEDLARQVRDYEHAHKARSGVLGAVERELADA